jgi:hypothetical protein
MWIQLKKWWKIGLIILVSVIILAYYLFLKKDPEVVDPLKSSEKLKDGLNEIKERISEVSNKAVVEAAIAKTKVEVVKEDLNEISKEKDAKVRRSRLAELAERVADY